MITIQSEPWKKVAPEFDALGVLNYLEADITEGREAYSLDHETMAYLDDGDMVNITTVREGEELVGYALSVITPRHIQYQLKVAQYLGVYVLPEYRKGRTGLNLLTYDESVLRARGVQALYGGFAMGKNLKVLFDRLGWQMAEFTYTKRVL